MMEQASFQHSLCNREPVTRHLSLKNVLIEAAGIFAAERSYVICLNPVVGMAQISTHWLAQNEQQLPKLRYTCQELHQLIQRQQRANSQNSLYFSTESLLQTTVQTQSLVFPLEHVQETIGLMVVESNTSSMVTPSQCQQLRHLAANALALILQQQLQEYQHLSKLLIEQLPTPILKLDLTTQQFFGNHAAKQLFGIQTAQLLQTTLSSLPLSPEVQNQWTQAINASRHRGTEGIFVEYLFERNEKTCWLESQFVSVEKTSLNTPSVLVISRDITAHRQSQEALYKQANHDLLTGLPNRLCFVNKLNALITQRNCLVQPFAILLLDLDRFKFLNEAFGHLVGDQCLQIAAQRLSEVLLPDETLARLGGDEFAVLLENTHSLTIATSRAEVLRSVFSDRFYVSGHELLLSASVGVTMSHEEQPNANELLNHVTSAKYRAKERGRDRVEIFDAELQQKRNKRMQLRNELRYALDRDELEIYYQPEVDLESGLLVGVEALIRWNHPTRGFLSAAAFIDVAEESGMIIEIGSWILQKASQQMGLWQKRFPREKPLILRVNLSACQLGQQDLVPCVANVLRQSKMIPGTLCLEITETSLMQDAETGLRILRHLNELGVQLAVDDFGTGYSSLSYLKRFPVHVLKVDRSFVIGLAKDPDDVAIVSTIISLAESLGLRITAEGIEDPAQINILRGMHQMHAQGYLFAKPLPATEIEAFLVPQSTLPWARLWN